MQSLQKPELNLDLALSLFSFYGQQTVSMLSTKIF